VAFEISHDGSETSVASGVELGELVKCQGVPDAGNDVLALSARQVVAI
jgi:hypothetical protein